MRRHFRHSLAVALMVAACGSSPSPSPLVAPTAAPSASPAASAPAAASATPSSSLAPGSACTPAIAPAAHDWNQRVWYEAFVRSFADSNGDGIGDFRGMTAKLDYLNDGKPATTTDLGVTGLWLMPVFASPSYHGYDVTDYTKLNPQYGTLADFKALLAAAHQRGIKVILDLPVNHTSDQHPWFKASATGKGAYADWYVWSDKNAFLGPDGQVVWHPLGDRYYYGVFSDAMPDLNLRNEAVTAQLDRIADYWLADIGVDGFRIDAAKHLIEDGRVQTNTPETLAWLKAYRANADAANKGAVMVGEVWDVPATAGKYVPDSLDLTFNFGLAQTIVLALNNGRAAPLKTGLADTLSAWPPNQSATFLSNHDQTRVMTQLGGDTAAAKLGALLLFTSPGVPFVYYGEEIGTTGSKPDEHLRTPMAWTGEAPAGGFSTGEPWEPLADGWETTNVTAQTADPQSLLSLYRTLVRLRGSEPMLQDGATMIVESNVEGVIGILRTLPDQTILTVANLSPDPVSDYTLDLASGPLCSGVKASVLATLGVDPGATAAAPDVTAQGGFAAYQPIPTIPGRGAVVLALEPAP